MQDKIKLGDTVEVMSYGKAIRGTVIELGKVTGNPIKMQRFDTNRVLAIIGTGNCRKVS